MEQQHQHLQQLQLQHHQQHHNPSFQSSPMYLPRPPPLPQNYRGPQVFSPSLKRPLTPAEHQRMEASRVAAVQRRVRRPY